MEVGANEEKLLRSVALQNARAVLLARERAEQELVEIKEALERRTGELDEQRKWLEVILSSIADAVITTDLQSRITFLNPAAETMIGWKSSGAVGQPLASVIKIVNEVTGEPAKDLIKKVLKGAAVVDLANSTALISSTGIKTAIEGSIAPTKDATGKTSGAVMVFRDVSARRKAHLERERLTSVLERSLNEIYIFDTEHLRFEYVNEGARRNLGYSLEEMQQITPLDLKPEFTDSAFREMVKPLLSGEREKHIFHTVHQRRDQTLYPVEVHLQAVSHAGHTVFLAVILDITEREKTEEDVRRSEEELRALADSIPQLAWIADSKGDVFWFNRRWYDYTGTTFEQVAGWQWHSLHDPKILPLTMERWKFSIETGQPFEMEFPLRGADGTFRWFLTRVNPVRNAENRVVRWFGTNTDVDQVKRASDALQEETRVLEILNDTGAAISSQLSLETLVQTVTDAGTRLSGAQFGAFFYNVSNDRGESFLLYSLSGAPREAFEKFGMPRNTPIFHPTFSGEGIVRSGDIMKDSRYGTLPPHHGMPKGHLPVRSYLSVPVTSRSGEVIGGLFFGHPETDVFTERSERLIVGIAAQAAIAIDNSRLYEAAQKEIAERKRAEAELQKTKDELEQRVFERTASLQETTEQLEAFCYTIAHDLRSPLRVQQSFARVLLEDYHDDLDEAGRGYAQRIINSAQRLDMLVDDLLSYSRISRSELKLENVDSNKVVRDVQANLANDIETAQASLSVDPLLPVSAYEPTLNLVLTNLVANALKFAKSDLPPRIRIWDEVQGDFVRLWVEDNGIGIEAEHQTKIFGVFERLHPMEKFPGTGIGLAIVQKGIERMGGHFGVESKPGKGSRFWIELPRAQLGMALP